VDKLNKAKLIVGYM